MAWRLVLAVQLLSLCPSLGNGADGRMVGVAPIRPTYCSTFFENSEPYFVGVSINGAYFRVLLDTGSSNFDVATQHCARHQL